MLNEVKSQFLSGKTITILFLILNSQFLIGQTHFQRTMGGTADDNARSIIRTTDGGYAVAGSTVSFGAGGNDFYIVKLDTYGTLQWSRTVGGTLNDMGYSIVQTTDGGYAVAGSTISFGAGLRDMYIVKLNGSGALQWSRVVGGTGEDFAYSIVQTTDGGCAVAGHTLSFGAGNYDIYILKLDASGTLQWSRAIGGSSLDQAYSMVRTADGGYALTGYTFSYGVGLADFYVIKLDAIGTLQWMRTAGGTSYDFAYSIIQATDGGYAAAGYTQVGQLFDMYIVKLSASGTFNWSRTIGGTSDEVANSIIQTTEGGYAAAGYTNSFGAGGEDVYIVRLSSGGALQWSRTVGGATGGDYAFSIIQTTDGGFGVAGHTYSFGAGLNDMYIVKLDAVGNTCGNFTPPTSTVTTPTPTLNSPTPTITIPTPTTTSPTSTTSTGGTVTPLCFIGIQPISNEMPASHQLYQNYPNPFNPRTEIKFALPKESLVKLLIYDARGREIETLVNEQLKPGTYEVSWDGANFASGVYYYRLTA